MPNAHYTASARNGQAGGFPVLDAFPVPQNPVQPPVWQTIFNFVKSEWKWLLTGVVPLLLAGGWLAMPASTAQVEKVKAAAAAEVALLKAEMSGQFQVVHTRVDDLKASLEETHTDIKELLRRVPVFAPEQEAAPPRRAEASPAPASSPPPPKRKTHSQPKPAGGWSLSNLLR
jgi:hypothetical protein